MVLTARVYTPLLPRPPPRLLAPAIRTVSELQRKAITSSMEAQSRDVLD